MDGMSPGEFLMGGDGLRTSAVFFAFLILVGGTVLLCIRVAAAYRGHRPMENVLVLRMVAVLGAMGGFIAYLRDLSLPAAPYDLILGGLAAAPWASLMLLEKIRKWILTQKKGGT